MASTWARKEAYPARARARVGWARASNSWGLGQRLGLGQWLGLRPTVSVIAVLELIAATYAYGLANCYIYELVAVFQRHSGSFNESS